MTEHEFIQMVKRRLRLARADSGEKMKDIYKNTNLSYPTVCKSFERGDCTNISLLTLNQLCDAIGVTMASLLDTPGLNEKMEINNKRTER